MPKMKLKMKRNMKSKATNTCKQLRDYKIFVFDLDYTLYLHKVDYYSREYHRKIRNFLLYLIDNGKILYIATHNKTPESYLDELNITNLFSGIIKELMDVCPIKNGIEDYTSKKDMIYEILSKESNSVMDDIIFFDDNSYNIDVVSSIGAKCIKVDETKGINFSDIF